MNLDDVRLARAYLSRVAEPFAGALSGLVSEVGWGHPCRFVWRALVPMRSAFWLLDRDGAPWRWW
ncbi:hypothetical protein Lesp02_35040 [Lentzea sp. NBRC 105346]|uniref:hypothetical protein n=1 Tax=Lentzea sp. NBRC 105346 TaxID=3032205 RepID=UPI0024A5956E|nr:hypothetical protein [Lentzea sp. NBRC 105346]GLZ31316.1 hypothetical protein Lesp02_35040 [Lentzea sp. NBRC 105346]